MSLLASQEKHLLRNESLSKYTAARLGGPAEMLYIARSPQSLYHMVEVIQAAWAEDIPVLMLGGGSNVLISDAGVSGLVVINRINDVQFDDWHDGRTVSATAGTSLPALAQRCALRGITGMEWAVGVPGTVGGAIVNNAGAHGESMADSVADVVVLEPGGPELYTRDDLKFDYRTSMLKQRADRRYVVLLATLKLSYDAPGAVSQRMADYNQYRKKTQPPGASLGSIFKNPPGHYAGQLIESCDLKGYRQGQVQVSPVHANFFVNLGDASATDYRVLIDHVQSVVARQTGIDLEPEIELVGNW